MARSPQPSWNVAPLVTVYGGVGALFVWVASPRSPSTEEPTCDGKTMRPGDGCEFWHGPGHVYSHTTGYAEAKQDLVAGHSWVMPWAAIGMASIVLALLLAMTIVSRKSGRGLPERVCAGIRVMGVMIFMLAMVAGVIVVLIE